MDLAALASTLIKAGAPVLGGALGGPAGAALAPMILGALTEALGLPGDASPEAVAQAVVTGPASASVVQRVEAEQAPSVLTELNARLADVQNARALQEHALDSGSRIAWSPTIVSVIVLIGFSALSVMAMQASPGSAQREIILFLLGAWLSLATSAVNFWLGSSSSSKDKDATLASIARAGRPR